MWLSAGPCVSPAGWWPRDGPGRAPWGVEEREGRRQGSRLTQCFWRIPPGPALNQGLQSGTHNQGQPRVLNSLKEAATLSLPHTHTGSRTDT